MKPIEKGWNSYRSMVIPKNAPQIQIDESKKAFFAGAAILWEGLQMCLSEEAEPTIDDMKKMQEIQDELDAYEQQLDKDVLGINEH